MLLLYRLAGSFKLTDVFLGRFHSRIFCLIRLIAVALIAGRKLVHNFPSRFSELRGRNSYPKNVKLNLG